ncbi:PAAR domain-containing protein [Vibrio sp. ZSDZ65]|uniref:PAAR domain-containing protein n=1 Tax=Vibrio qingdaonensis TaxID=2829491 RepID=A0A9X3CJI3_9VIBR|nr:PAAR domain-containing protein [Vibrio qingdaonensis]MCW8344579.1 PAAR domain-containing protein [Vibrio qingdaonensis]
MTLPASRITDMHVCPMQTPAVPPIPHVGGPIIGPGVPTVLIGNMPASVMGDMCTCVGPPDSIVKGSATVLISNRPAARLGDTTSHGGTIVVGMPTVLIGG